MERQRPVEWQLNNDAINGFLVMNEGDLSGLLGQLAEVRMRWKMTCRANAYSNPNAYSHADSYTHSDADADTIR